MPHVCPWWGGYFIDNPLRLLHNAEKILGPYVKPGMTVMDVGCGMGFFSIAMAQMVGDQGRVIAADLQEKMLDVLRRRAEKAGTTALASMASHDVRFFTAPNAAKQPFLCSASTWENPTSRSKSN